MVFSHSVGLGVTIHALGAELVEHKDPNEGPSTSSCVVASRYVEAIGDTEFYVQYDFSDPEQHPWIWNGPYAAIQLDLLIDGAKVDSVVLDRDNVGSPQVVLGQEYIGAEGKHLLNKFRFAAIATVEDKDKKRIEREIKEIEHLGLIEVQVFRLQQPPQQFTKPSSSGFEEFPSRKPQLEFAAKAVLEGAEMKGKTLTYRTSHSKPIPSSGWDVVKTTDKDAYPFAIFKFKYRSKDGLYEEDVLKKPANYLAVKPEYRVKMERAQPIIMLESGLCFDLTQGDEVVELPRWTLQPKREVEAEVIDLTNEMGDMDLDSDSDTRSVTVDY